MLKLFKSRITAPAPTVQAQPPAIHSVYYNGTICCMKFQNRREVRGGLNLKLADVPKKQGDLLESVGLSAFTEKVVERIDDRICVCKSAAGKPVLYIQEEIPTFDAGDRMYDSRKHLLFVADRRGVHLIECRHGYELGSLTVYSCMTEAKAAVRPLLEKAGLPIGAVQFID